MSPSATPCSKISLYNFPRLWSLSECQQWFKSPWLLFASLQSSSPFCLFPCSPSRLLQRLGRPPVTRPAGHRPGSTQNLLLPALHRLHHVSEQYVCASTREQRGSKASSCFCFNLSKPKHFTDVTTSQVIHASSRYANPKTCPSLANHQQAAHGQQASLPLRHRWNGQRKEFDRRLGSRVTHRINLPKAKLDSEDHANLHGAAIDAWTCSQHGFPGSCCCALPLVSKMFL